MALAAAQVSYLSTATTTSLRLSRRTVSSVSYSSKCRSLQHFSGLRRITPLDELYAKPPKDFHAFVMSILPNSVKSNIKHRRAVPVALIERFNVKAVNVILLAQREAERPGHKFVGTELILLGLIREDTALAATVLKSMGVNLKEARVEVEKIIGRGSGFDAADLDAVNIRLTPRAKRVLQLSAKEATDLGHNCIGPEHILLGLLREGEGVAARVLKNLGVDATSLRAQVTLMLEESRDAVSSSTNRMMTLNGL